MLRIPGKLAALTAGAVTAAALSRLRRERNAMTLDDRVVLITGGSRGLGLALAEELARSGAKVAICARDADEISVARARLNDLGAEVLAGACDVSNEADVHRFVNDVEHRFGRIDVLINNAGLIMVGPARAFTASDYQRSMDTIYWGAVYPTLAALPAMIERGSGRIVNITSIGGYISVPHLLPYSAAKFALVGFSEGLTADLSGTGVKVTTVAPDVMRTGSYPHARFKGQHKKEYGWFAVGASLPLSSISASHATKAILSAVRRGDAVALVGWKTHLAVRLHGLMPDMVVNALGFANRLLPDPSRDDDLELPGHACESPVTQSFITTLGRRAGHRYNQYRA